MNFNEYTQHLQDGDVPILGYLVWYNVPGSALTDFELFNDLVKTTGAPIREMKAPKLPDVFRRACNEAKLLKRKSLDDTFLNFTMRDAGHDSGFVFRNMVEERVDSENHKLGFREIDKAVFGRDTGNTTFTREVASDDPAMPYISEIEASIVGYVETHKSLLPAIQIREAARISLEVTLNGLRVRPAGGIYFVSLSHSDELQALLDVYNSLAECSLHVLPLVDDGKQREMLREAFESESVDATTELIGEIIALQASGDKISSRKFLSFQQRYADLVTKMEEYNGILSTNLDRSVATLEVANERILSLLNATTDKE